MLKYLFLVTENLILAGIITGILFSFMKTFYGRKGRNAMFIACGVSVIAAAIMAYFKNNTKKFDMSIWNLRTFIAFFAVFVIFIVFTIGPLRRLTKKPGEYIAMVLGGVLLALVGFYELPDVIAYPSNFDLANNSIFSTDFIYRFIGYLLALILVLVTGLAVYRMMMKMSKVQNAVFMRIALSLLTVSFLGNFFSVLLNRRIISMKSPIRHDVFTVTKYLQNYSNWFIYAGIALAVVAAVILFVKNTKVTQEYNNPAQLRKIRAGMRNSRRWAAAMAVCGLIGVFNLTVVYALDNQEVQLSAAEECELRGDSLYVSFEQVEDGHLHRFVYRTKNNIDVRFIVIKKPNSQAYGVGLDACDICGETGYYERDGQVVCNLCDVVMNINTIGFKGGCNPIVIDYKIENGYIIVPVAALEENESKFK
ncbi:MAG: DUF2318 domain-containing protein [Clostridia bacterium]|nr:DUF2318 domain-containing protein [Clostridia bacterium]